jgi:hypothetical protein
MNEERIARIAEPGGPKLKMQSGDPAMNHIGQHKAPADPDPKLVECAIAKVLEIAQRQGISAGDFVRMLDSGMRISDFLVFLNAVDILADADHTVNCDTAN